MIHNQGATCDLLARIENLRHLMVTAGLQYGLGSQETIQYSEQLDELILQYQFNNIESSREAAHS